MVSDPKGQEIIDVMIAQKGKVSDISLLRQQQLKLTPNQKFIGDKAYVGASQTTTPLKKPKGGELTTQQKEENREISRQRILIEHLIRRLKIFRIAGDKFRLNSDRYETAILTICGLVRLRIGTLSL